MYVHWSVWSLNNYEYCINSKILEIFFLLQKTLVNMISSLTHDSTVNKNQNIVFLNKNC